MMSDVAGERRGVAMMMVMDYVVVINEGTKKVEEPRSADNSVAKLSPAG